MKKLIALLLVLLCVWGAISYFTREPALWDFMSEIKEDDIVSITPWSQDNSFESFSTLETQNLIILLNNLSKESFTENRDLRGGTPNWGLAIETTAETFYINQSISPEGALEIKYNDTMWWIDNLELLTFIQNIIDMEK